MAKANLLGKKYLIIQNGMLGGFSFFHLGLTVVLFGVLRAFQIPTFFYQKRHVEGIRSYSLFLSPPAPLLFYYHFHCCHHTPRSRVNPPSQFGPFLPSMLSPHSAPHREAPLQWKSFTHWCSWIGHWESLVVRVQEIAYWFS